MDYSTLKFVTDSNQGMQGRFESDTKQPAGEPIYYQVIFPRVAAGFEETF